MARLSNSGREEVRCVRPSILRGCYVLFEPTAVSGVNKRVSALKEERMDEEEDLLGSL